MANDNSVEISFSASTDDALAGIAQVHDALAGLTRPVEGLGSNLDRLGETFGSALPLDLISQCGKGMTSIGTAAQAAAGQVQGIGTQIQLMHIKLGEQRTLLDAEVSQFKITQDQKFALLQEETQKEYDAELSLLNRKLLLGDLDARQQQIVHDKLLVMAERNNADMLRLDEQSIAGQQAMWNTYLSTLTGAFNSQLRGLLAGTTSWSAAFKHMLGDIIIKFIEMCEQMVVKWAAAQIAQTTATTSGAAARAAAEQSASSAGIASVILNAMKSIFASAGQTSAEVAAWAAPYAGPAAPGIGAAAGAAVIGSSSALAMYDVGTDYVTREGIGYLHKGERIIPEMPMARGSGPFTGAGMGGDVHIHMPFNITAMDGRSVARVFNDNGGALLKAINDAARRGAHTGLRGVRA